MTNVSEVMRGKNFSLSGGTSCAIDCGNKLFTLL